VTQNRTPHTERQAAALEREANAPYVDEVTARGVAREEMGDSTPQAPEDGPPGVSEIKPDYMTLYKRVEYGWKPTIVSRGSVEACIESGAFRFECGDCGGYCGAGPNDCPGRDKLKFTRCPLRSCRKQLFDTLEAEEGEPEEEDDADPDEVSVLPPNSSTTESRLRIKLNRHLRFAHLSTAEELGVGQDPLFMLPGALQMAAAMTPAVPHPVHPADRAQQ